MKVIITNRIDVGRQNNLRLPLGATFMHFREFRGYPVLLFSADEKQTKMQVRTFVLLDGTKPYDDELLAYIATAPFDRGERLLHLFEGLKPITVIL